MCDQDHFEEDLKKYTRRDVGVLAAAVSAAFMLPRAANAVDVKESEVTIKTADGECDAYFVAPATVTLSCFCKIRWSTPSLSTAQIP